MAMQKIKISLLAITRLYYNYNINIYNIINYAYNICAGFFGDVFYKELPPSPLLSHFGLS